MILICTASDGANLKLCRRVEATLKERGVDTCLVDLTAAELPLYTSRLAHKPNGELISALGQSFRRAEGFFFAAPEYNGSIPPTLSNAIAWLSTETKDFRVLFNNKPAVIATHSGGGGEKLLTSLRIQLSHLGVNVLGRALASKGDGEVNEASLNEALDGLIRFAQIN
jgi:chromate reductase